MTKLLKRPLSIILAVLMVMSVFIAVPMTASAVTRDDVQSLLDSMGAMIDDYVAQNDWDHADALINYYNPLSQALYQANGQVTPDVESAYSAAYTYFTANGGTVSGGQGGSYPNVNNVYRATNDPVEVTVSDLQPGDVIVTSSAPMEVEKGDCTIVLVGGTYGEGDPLEGILFQTYPNDVTLGDELRFTFDDNQARITDRDSNERYDAVYNNSLGNAYIVLGNDNGTVYLAGYYFTTYTITWKDYNGSNLYDGQSTVAAGAVPSYRWSVSRNSTAQYSYTFTGWTDSSNTFYSKDGDLPAATKDETYTATYSETLRSYTITWKDGDDKTLKSDSVAYGTTPSYTGATPTKTEDDDYTYEFNNTWSPSVASVTGNATYTAQFTAVPKPAPGPKTVDLSTLSGDYEAQDGDVLTGTLSGNKKITIADGATVTLRNVDITLASAEATYAGITPLGDATILLEGENTVQGGYGYPGVYSAEGATLTIDGTGSLTVSSDGYGAGIGSGASGEYTTCGDITINGGTITATGASYAAGIGSGYQSSSCGNITINGGTITTNGGSEAPGIGSGTYRSSCGNITINGGTVDATGGDKSPAIGGGYGDNNKNQSKCGNITIADTVTKVTATKGSNALNTIGGGYSVPAFMTWAAPCGTITISGVEGAISTSPYTYEGTPAPIISDNPLGLAPIIGFQKKAADAEHAQGVRIITKIEDVDLTQFDEYGYVVVKVTGKQQETANFNNMKAYGGNGEKTIKCNGTVNTIDGYGTPYVTLAVNGMNDGDQVAARFYAIKDGVTYYSNYVSTARYNGIIATY